MINFIHRYILVSFICEFRRTEIHISAQLNSCHNYRRLLVNYYVPLVLKACHKISCLFRCSHDYKKPKIEILPNYIIKKNNQCVI